MPLALRDESLLKGAALVVIQPIENLILAPAVAGAFALPGVATSAERALWSVRMRACTVPDAVRAVR